MKWLRSGVTGCPRVPGQHSKWLSIFYIQKWLRHDDNGHTSSMVSKLLELVTEPNFVMNIVNFEAMKTFIVTDDMNAWDAEWGCVDAVQSVDAAQ